ncbi:protogenin [Topomyia yanbarensis]|uniref:protogenin n=1 Tax=Topomyia yanbarensis TaxID=2498891 RepID=UPI00273CEEDA|nr:protogenin [Topomyia yanbarensis]
MALLFRYCPIFALGLLLLNGFIFISVSAFVNKAGPDRLRLTLSPPAHVIITATKNSPVYLPCHAEADIDPNDWADSEMDMDDVEYENTANEEVDILQSPQIERQGFYEDTIDLNNLAHDNINTNTNDNDLEEEDEYDEDNSDRYRRSLYGRDDLIEYVWYRNGLEFFSTTFQNQNHKQTHKGFRLFPNGTLKIPYNRQMSNISAGIYRCKANLTRHGTGSILSTESVVTVAYLERDNALISGNNTVVTTAHGPLVLHCPFASHPPANITWMVNRTQILTNNYPLDAQENRFYQLQNGSLLLIDIKPSDAGRYRCNATNNYAAKNFRSYGYVVIVQSSSSTVAVERLLPRMQQQVQHVHVGSTLKLNCAGEMGRPRWTFTPRRGKIPIQLTNFTNQLLFNNVSAERHEGVYNCSLGADFHVFNVTIIVPPMFLNNMTSYTSSVVASMSFNCSVSGNPQPKITWFKNGREIKNSYIIHYNYHILRIHTIDPEDEGLYQCIAKNDAGESSVSMYLSIRDKDKYRRISKRPDSIQCFPLDTTSLYVRFERSVQQVNTEYVMYYLASDDPYSWYSSPPTQLLTNSSMKISGPMVVPFRNYTVYLRACSVTSVPDAEYAGPAGKKQVIPSKLSKGVECTSQGVPVLSIFLRNGIFIWWPRYAGLEPTAYVIQIKHNDNSNLTFLTDKINGTRQILDDYTTHEEVEPLLTKINVTVSQVQESILDESNGKRKRRRRAFDIGNNPKQIFESLTGTQLDPESYNGNTDLATQAKHDKKFRQVLITQVKVSGNVTGILFPDTKNIVVRILGSVAPDGEPLKQDLRFVQWKTIDSSIRRPDTVNRFQANHVDARSVQFTWSRFIATDLINKCLTLCYKNVNHDVFIRGGSNRVNCVNIQKDATHFNLIGLLPFTLYKAFLKPCHSKEPISDVLDFQTKQDVPGPVTNHALVRKDGLALTWGPPENRNGILQGYLIEWVDKDKVHSAVNLTVSANHFQFPNVSTDEKINISIRAIGSTGIGIPIYMNLLNHVDVTYENEPVVHIPWIEIMIGTLIVMFLLLFCSLLLVHRNHCKKRRRNQAATAASTAMQIHSASCNADVHEMQTLIRTPEQLPVLIPNGNYKQHQTQKSMTQPPIVNNLEGARDPNVALNLITSSGTINGKSQPLSSNKNGLVPQTNISSLTTTTLLPIQQPSVSSQVLGRNISIQYKSPLKVSTSSEDPIFDLQQQGNFATSSNSIYNSLNSSYLNVHQHCNTKAAGGCNRKDKHNHSNIAGVRVRLQPKHSSRTNDATIAAEQVPSSAATSTSLSSASNFSGLSSDSSGSNVSSCSCNTQSRRSHNSIRNCCTSNHSNSSNGYIVLGAAPVALNATPVGVRITENPQYSKRNNIVGHHSPSAVLNTSLFDSSQHRLLDLTIDSNSVEPYADDVTNCDQNDYAIQPATETVYTCNEDSPDELRLQQKTAQNHLDSVESTLEEDDNNNEQQSNSAINDHHSECVQLRRQQLLDPRHLTYCCTESSTASAIECTLDSSHENGDFDDGNQVGDTDNTSSLLDDSNLSSKPLHQQHTSNWSFRRPIVGPNG